MVHLRGRYDDEFGSARFDMIERTRNLKVLRDRMGGGSSPRSPRYCNLGSLTPYDWRGLWATMIPTPSNLEMLGHRGVSTNPPNLPV